ALPISERCTRIRRSVLRNGFLLFCDLERLDRHGQLARLLVEYDHACIDLLTNGEALWTLLVTVTRKIRALDEGLYFMIDQTNVEAAVLNTDDFTGNDRTLAQDRKSTRLNSSHVKSS